MQKLRISMLIVLLSVCASAFAITCSTPTGTDWRFVDYVDQNKRQTSSSPISYGAWSRVASQVNPRGTSQPYTLSTTTTRTTTYYGDFSMVRGYTNSTQTVQVRVSVTIPPYMRALLETRPEWRTYYYAFDVACLWQNRQTGQLTTTTQAAGRSGSERRDWYGDQVRYESAY